MDRGCLTGCGAVLGIALPFFAAAFLMGSLLPLIIFAWLLIAFIAWAIVYAADDRSE